MAEQEEVAKIPLVEERLAVSKREVETGRLRVRISVDAHEEHIETDLSRDEVEIRRVPKNIALQELPGVRIEGETTIIPVVEEEVIVEKRLVLVEEIHVSRKTSTVQQAVPVTVHAERAELERIQSPMAEEVAQ